MTCLRGALAAGMGALLVSGSARAETPPRPVFIEMDDGGSLPFSEAELREALSARLPTTRDLGTASIRLAVGCDEAGVCVLANGSRERRVSLGHKRGREAARVMALMARDFVEDEPTFRQWSAEPAVEMTAAEKPAAPIEPPFLRLSALPQVVPLVTTSATLAWEASLGASVRLISRWALVGAVAYGRLAVERTGVSPAKFASIAGRLGVSGRAGRWAAAGGLVVRHYRTSGWDPARSGQAWGGWLGAEARLRSGPGWSPFVAGGLDLLIHRLEFQLDESRMMATRYVMPWLGLGLAWP